MRKSITLALPAAIAAIVTLGFVPVTKALADESHYTVTYDAGDKGLLPNPEYETDPTKPQSVRRVSYDVASGSKHKVIDAPTPSVMASSLRAVPYDAQGGKIEGEETAWSHHASTDRTFNGWATASDGNGEGYEPGDEIDVEGDITLYAQWIEAETYGSDPLANATRDGYTFDGWYTEAEGGTLIGKAGDEIDREQAYKISKLYAHWTPVPTSGGGAASNDSTASNGGANGGTRTNPGDLMQTGAIRDTPVTTMVLVVVTGVAGIAGFAFMRRRS
jgi:uncharacterized repeat protein (TIGR02543 family)